MGPCHLASAGAHAPRSASKCPDSKNDGTGTASVTRRPYVMTINSDGRRGGLLGVVERYRKKQGYSITSVRNSADMPAIFATAPDGFEVGLEFEYKGQAGFQVLTVRRRVEGHRGTEGAPRPQLTGNQRPPLVVLGQVGIGSGMSR